MVNNIYIAQVVMRVRDDKLKVMEECLSIANIPQMAAIMILRNLILPRRWIHRLGGLYYNIRLG